ncbi:MAG: 16S rRNA (guanine(527)-N(7))-methyltransferase RsmG [Paracoccaceae bacterium]
MIIRSDELMEGLSVSRETMERLKNLVTLVEKWNPTINLIAKSTTGDVWARHILDSAQLYLLAPEAATQWVDLGSGGGFPGLVISCIAAEKRPQMNVTLVEADQRKATFLRQAGMSLGLNLRVVVARIESVEPLNAEIISARALAPLDILLGFTSRHMAADGLALLQKGANYAAEITAARKNWSMSLEAVASKTEPNAAILVVKALSHV